MALKKLTLVELKNSPSLSTGSAAALPLVSVWLLDKRLLLAASADSPEEAEAALAAARAGAAALSRVRHPCLVRVIEPLEETRHVLALVTEGVWGTASELLTDYSDTSSSSSSSSARAKEARSVSRLEVLHGLANVSRALAFLHRDSSAAAPSSSSSSGSSAIVHRAVAPSAVVLTRSGGWKVSRAQKTFFLPFFFPLHFPCSSPVFPSLFLSPGTFFVLHLSSLF